MLSSSNTVKNVKETLMKDYRYYGFQSDEEYTACITRVSFELQLRLKSIISEKLYNEIARKDSMNLTLQEESIYWGEVNLIASEFLSALTLGEQKETGTSESLSVEGYSRTISKNESTASGKEGAALTYFLKGRALLSNAGFIMHKLTYVESDYAYM